MKQIIAKIWLGLTYLICSAGVMLGADVQYAADNASGEYSEADYTITVSVSTPATGAVVKYSESATGPWQDAPIFYKDVCNAKPIYFQITAEGYTTVVDSRTVTINAKPISNDFVWLVFPSVDYVYDGTAKMPDVACGDGNPSIITTSDFSVSFENNINAGTATAIFTGKGNYIGTATEDFEIFKADNEWITEPSIAGWTFAQAPSEPVSAAKVGTATVTYGASGTTRPTLPGDYVATFTVPESENYNDLTKDVPFTIAPATINYVADNASGEYSGADYTITVSVSTPATGAVVKYSESPTGPWQDAPIFYKDVCNAKPIYFQITAEGYTTVVDSRTVTINAKQISNDFVWLVFPPDDYIYDGTAKIPDVACGDGNPSIITTSDFSVSFENNINAGTATATFTGKGNYTGIATEDFEIFKADNEWITEPSIAGWTYAQTPSEPVSAAKVGTATVTYGASGTTRPTLPGNYVATFTFPESENYNELTKDVSFTISPATINYVADDVSGEYSGADHTITVSVSTPATGAVVKYSESATGPWQDAPIFFKDVCNAKPIYFQITAEGYTKVVDSRTVTINAKPISNDFVWLVFPPDDYIYDGTAKIPDVACGDGNPSIITTSDFSVSFENNINAGTATATFTGKGNYTGIATEDFEIFKADNEWITEPSIAGWTFAQAPSEPVSAAKVGTATVTYGARGTTRPTLPGDYVATFTVPESENYNELTKDVPFTIAPATINYVADNASGEYSGADYTITVSVSTPATGAVVKYSESATGPWQDAPIFFKDVCNAKPIYFQITAEGYTTVVDSRTVTINAKPISNDFVWLVLPPVDYVYDGTAKIPDVACGDGNPSIITTSDFSVSFENNINAGTATATFTGKGNYTGTATEDFEIIKADNEWITEPSLAGWTYAQAPSEPVSAAKVGTAIVTYGASGTTRPTLPGNYVATFTVPESENYNELTKDVSFTIAPAPNLQAGLTAEIKWSYLRATGTYFAQLSVVCTNGVETGISSLRFMFADRIGSDGKQEAALWDSSKRTANSNTLQYNGESYRYVELNASKITENNKPVIFGVSDVNATTIPVSERIIEMYVHRRVVPEIGNEGAAKVGDFVGFVTWESDGKTYSIPVVAGTSTLYSSFKAMRTLSMPLSREKLNNSLAMGVPLDSNSSPYCRLTEFSVNDLTISGKVEVGAISSENQIEKGSIGINASVTLLGASTLGSPFVELTTVNTAEDGSFTIEKPEEACFFKIRIDILDIVK